MKDLDKVEVDILRDRIVELNKEQLRMVSHMAKDYFIMEYLDLGKLEEDRILIRELDNSSEKYRILEIYEKLRTIFLELAEESRTSKEELLSIREELYEYSELLSAYYIELKYVKTRMDNLLIGDREKSLDMLPGLDKTRSRLIEDIEDHMMSLGDRPLEYINFMASVTNILPFKLSKYKYYDLIKNSLKSNLRDYSKEDADFQIQEYKKQFDPKLNRGYGLYFDEYFTSIEVFKRIDLEERTINQLKEDIRRANILLEAISYNMMNIRRIGLLTNRLLTIALILENYDMALDKDLLDSFKTGDKNLASQVRERFKDNEARLFELIDDFQSYNDELARRELEMEELDQEFDRARSMLVYYNDLEFTSNELLKMDRKEKIRDKDLERLIDSLIDFIKRNIKGMEVEESRLRMKALLTVFTPSFRSLKDFMDYLNYALDDRISSPRELNRLLISLNYLLERKED